MGLHLTGKGSILDAIGGALHTGANAIVAGVKDVGDIGSLGLANLTGNDQAAANARAAIAANDRNLSGESLGANLAGLGSDIAGGVVNPFVRPAVGLGVGLGEDVSNWLTGNNMTNEQFARSSGLPWLYNYASNKGQIKNLGNPRQVLGNAIQTGVNVATLGKGRALEQGLESVGRSVLGDNLAGRVGARVIGGAGTGEVIGAGQGTGQAVATAKTPQEAVSDIITPAEQLGALGAAGGVVSKVPDIARTAKENTTPLDEVGGINNRPVPPPGEVPNISEEDLARLHQSNQPSAPPPSAPAEPSLTDLQESAKAAAALEHDFQNPTIDWGQVQGASTVAARAVSARAQTLRQMEGGLTGGKLQKTAEGYARTSEHSPFYREFYRANGHPPRQDDWLAEADRQLRSGTDAESRNYQSLLQHAQAEKNLRDYLQADKQSGYARAKYQIPKGAPAKPFVKALFEKTHSPEYDLRNRVGSHLQDVRDTIKGVKILRDRAQKEYDQLTKKGSGAKEPEIRAKAAELRSQNVRYNILKEQERLHAANYVAAKRALDEKYPDITLGAKKGVRLTSNQAGFETARPVKPVVEKPTSTPARAATYEGYKSSTPTKPYTGPNLNEGAFTPEDIAKLDAKIKADEAAVPGLRNPDGDRVILEGIKRGDSDAAIIKDYQEVTGADEATAKKAYGVLEEDPFAEKAGAPSNNPQYGKHPDYAIGKAPTMRGANKVLVTTKAGRNRLVRNTLLNKVVLRGTAPGKLLEIKRDLARHDWEQLSPKDQALADKLRDHSIEEIASKAKNPEAFTRYANRIKDIQDMIHAVRNVADPFDITPYRQHYGASFHLEDKNGNPTTVDQYLGREYNWAKGRHFSNYADIEEASGLKRSTENFHEDVERDVYGADRYIASHSIYNGLIDAFGKDAAHYGNKSIPRGLVQLKEFPDVYAKPELAERINDREFYRYRKDALGGVLRGYDALNAPLKASKLSFGGFHNINIGLSQTALDHAGVLDSVQAWKSDPFYREQLDKWAADGTLEKALHGGVTLNAGPEFDSNLVAKLPGVKQLHAALFQRQIPMSKMLVFEKYTKGLSLDKNYEDIRGVARGVNNIFGGINRLVDGMSSNRLKLMGRTILATDYNEGQIRTLLSALSKGGKEGEMARRMIGGRMALLASPGTIQGIITSQIGKNPEDVAKFVGKQLFDPSISTNWKTAGGVPKRISLLATVTNKFYRAVAPALNPNNPDKASGLKQEAAGNLSALASLVESEWKNSDYYGNPMHGHGMNVLQDVAAAANSAAPIPAGPLARYVEGTRAGKNVVVTTLAGGQSPISPAEAAVDISGVGRGQADPDSPQMQIMNNRQMVRESLSPDDQGALDKIHPTWNPDLSRQQIADIYNNPNYESNKWTTLASNPAVLAALKKQNDFAKVHGEPSNPLFDLPAKDQQIVIRYQQLKSSDPGSDANDTAAAIYAEHKDLISGYETAVGKYSDAMNALFKQSGGVKGQPGPEITPGGVPFPNITQAQQDLATQLQGITDGKQRAQFLTDHPELGQMFTALANYENARRAKMGEPLLKDYPQAPPGLENWITQYVASDKARRAALRNASPNQFKAMQSYMAQVDEYNLARTAGIAKFQGHDFSQANLKEIYNLGQYDIVPTKNADGTTTYSVNPESGGAGGGHRGGSSRGYSSLKASNQRREAHGAVKFAGRMARIRIHTRAQNKRRLSKYYPQKHLIIAKAKPQTGTLRIKSKAVL